MDWNTSKSFWPNSVISKFSECRPYLWHLQDTGDRNKPILLLIHGTGASTHSWRLLLPMLRDSFRVIAVDLPGHGFTKISTHNRLTLNMITEDLLSLLTQERVNPQIIVGHSAGAALSFKLALNFSSCHHVISVNGVLDNYFEGLSRIFYPIAAKALATSPFSAHFMAKISKLAQPVRKLNEITGSKIDSFGLTLYEKLFSDPDHVYGTLAMMSQWKLDSLGQDLNSFKNRSLFLVGENDKMVTAEALKNYSKLVKNSTTQIEENLGHLMHEEKPELIAYYISNFFSGEPLTNSKA